MLIRVFIVEERLNPSTDYFILPLFASEQYCVQRCRFNELPERALLEGAVIVLVRYVSPQWRALIQVARSSLRQLYFFMDDDVLDISATAGMPWKYRAKLFYLATRHYAWLLAQQARFLVSTAYLQEKYAAQSPQVLSPMPLPEVQNPVKVFYHGSITHMAEIKWLCPIVEAVLAQAPNVCFEFMGNEQVRRWLSGFQRVQVVNLMPWSAYLFFSQQAGRDIGLVPLLNNEFNAARSYTKFLDVTRCGAVGLYAEGSECAKLSTSGVDGLVLPMQQEMWIEAILILVNDKMRRASMFDAAKQKIDSLQVTPVVI